MPKFRPLLKCLWAVFLVGAVSSFLIWVASGNAGFILTWAQGWLGLLARIHPLYLILAIIFTPFLGVPVSVLFLIAAGAYHPAESLIVSVIGIALHLLLAHQVSSRWMRRYFERLLRKWGHDSVDLPSDEYLRTTVLVRIMPGIPFIIQNILLGVSGVPLKIYFWVSLPLQSLWMAGTVLTAGAVFEGKMGILILGICFVVAGFLLAPLLRKIYGTRL